MKQVKFWAGQFVWTLKNREEGQGLVEYSLILGAIAVGAIVLLQAIGSYVTTTLTSVKNAL